MKQITDLQDRIEDDIVHLQVKRRSILSDNYGKFVGVHEHLQTVLLSKQPCPNNL